MTNDSLTSSVTNLGDSPWGKNLSILIVEDHEIVREGLHRLVTRALAPQMAAIVVHYAASLREANEIIRDAHEPLDLILLDLELEDAHAEDCIACIRDEWGGLPVAIVSANDDWAVLGKLVEYDVLGVIPKKSNVDIIASAIRLIAAGGRYFPEGIMRLHHESQGGESGSSGVLNNIRGVPASPDIEQSNKQVAALTIDHELISRLSPRQQAVLALMAEGLSNKEIAKLLGLSVGTAKNYVSSILRVLGVTRRSAAIRIATTLQFRQQERNT